ncbi:hypothetical protein HZS_6316 [Henneguya salminicola]|nr:hypothetical protein HZS_6316 [Henneguya salminicola]
MQTFSQIILIFINIQQIFFMNQIHCCVPANAFTHPVLKAKNNPKTLGVRPNSNNLFIHKSLKQLHEEYHKIKGTIFNVNLQTLPDKGAKLFDTLNLIKIRIKQKAKEGFLYIYQIDELLNTFDKLSIKENIAKTPSNIEEKLFQWTDVLPKNDLADINKIVDDIRQKRYFFTV